VLNNIKDRITNNGLIKLGFINSISIVIKIIASIISSKALAIFVGPSGLAFIGIFREFINMFANVSSLGLQKGIVKYASELKTKSVKLNKFLSTTMILGLVVSIIFSILLFSFSQTINNYLFPNYDYSFVLKVFALITPITVFNTFYISILNGLGYLKNIIKINILLYVLNMIAVVVLSYYLKILGAMLAISFFSVLQLVSIFILKPKNVPLLLIDKVIFSKKHLNKLLGYTIMTITSLFLFPFISILIRNEIIINISEDAAGFWEAMKRISDNYLLFASSLVLLSVLPKLSENNTNENFKNVVFTFYKSIIPFFAIGLFLIFLLKDFIILLFYSKEFLPTISLVKWYALGDLFRIMGMVLAINFYANRDIKGYILTDIFLAVVMYISTIVLLRTFGLVGGAMAYLLSYVFYFILLVVVYRKKLL
jgi:PST family polysaccharide transporter